MLKVKKGLVFDDVVIVPKMSNIKSRADVNLSVTLPKGIKLKLPILSANMKDVTGVEMAQKLYSLGCMPILHRFDPYDVIVKNWIESTETKYEYGAVGVAVGIKEKDLQLVKELVDVGCKVICVDVAHGHHKSVGDFVSIIRKSYPDILIIAGNVCTPIGAEYLWESGADLIKVGVGNGCFAAGTRVLMSNGLYKNIEDIKEGDRIINKNGQPKTVLKSFSTGVKKVSKVRNSIFYEDTYVTPNHKYFIGDLSSVSKNTVQNHGYAKALSKPTKKDHSKFKWQEVGKSDRIAFLIPRNISFEMKDSFYKEITIRDGGNWLYENSKISKVDFVLEPSYELGYIFGTFLGDGCSHLATNGKTDIGSISWSFGLNEQFIVDKLNDCVKKITSRELKVSTPKDKNILSCRLYHKPFAEFLSSFGKRFNKHLPEEFFVNNKEYLKGIIDGLVDSDGHIEDNGRINFSNTSIYLIELFNICVYITTGVFPNNEKKQIKPGAFGICNIENFNTPYISRINTSANKRLIDGYQVSKLLECSETDKEMEVFDLTIDCDTHSFIANNAIVHNSICSTRIETGNGYPQLSALNNIYNHPYRTINGQHPMFISDGGIKVAGDVCKALTNADLVMMGGMLAGTNEAPGDLVQRSGVWYKQYAGSSTHKKDRVEGVVGYVKCKGPVEGVIKKISEGLQSACSYQGVNNLIDYKLNPEFVEISNAGLVESKIHDLDFVKE
jgi:IMP dehydrogenase/GMP reductase